MRKLIIKQGGILELEEQKYSEELEEWIETTKNVTLSSVDYIMETCEIEDGVTLRDIFSIVKINIALYSIILQNWVDEIVEEGLSATFEDEGDVEFLELYWNISVNRFESVNTLCGHQFPEFRGWGIWKKDPKHGIPEDQKGGFAIGMSPMKYLIDLPVKLNKTLDLYFDDEEKLKGYSSLVNVDKVEYTLFHILYGMFWELSFYGGPQQREQKREEINKDIEDVLSGKAGTVDGPYDSVWEALGITEPSKEDTK